MTDTATDPARQRSLRARIAAARERDREAAERRERLPEAVCAGCGGVVPAGAGTIADENAWTPALARWEWRTIDAERRGAGLPRLCAWRRRHDACATTAGIVRQLTGAVVAPEVAGNAVTSGRTTVLASAHFPDAVSADLAHRDRGQAPWAHLDDLALTALATAVDRARADVEPRRCSQGGCAWCGVRESIGWRSSPETWRDGSEAPLCRDCARVWDSRGRPADRDGLRRCALESLSGAAGPTGGDGLGIRAYVDLAGDDHSGTSESWSYAAEALDRLRERARLTWPGSLAPAIRDEYRARYAREHREAMQAAVAAAERERAAAESEAARAAGWPV